MDKPASVRDGFVDDAMVLQHSEHMAKKTLDERGLQGTIRNLFARLEADGQPGLVRALRSMLTGETDSIVVCESVGFSDDPAVHRAVVAFVEALGGKVFLVPSPDGSRDKTA